MLCEVFKRDSFNSFTPAVSNPGALVSFGSTSNTPRVWGGDLDVSYKLVDKPGLSLTNLNLSKIECLQSRLKSVHSPGLSTDHPGLSNCRFDKPGRSDLEIWMIIDSLGLSIEKVQFSMDISELSNDKT